MSRSLRQIWPVPLILSPARHSWMHLQRGKSKTEQRCFLLFSLFQEHQAFPPSFSPPPAATKTQEEIIPALMAPASVSKKIPFTGPNKGWHAGPKLLSPVH